MTTNKQSMPSLRPAPTSVVGDTFSRFSRINESQRELMQPQTVTFELGRQSQGDSNQGQSPAFDSGFDQHRIMPAMARNNSTRMIQSFQMRLPNDPRETTVSNLN